MRRSTVQTGLSPLFGAIVCLLAIVSATTIINPAAAAQVVDADQVSTAATSAVGERLLVIHDSVILGARPQIEAQFPESTVEYIGFGGLRVGPAADILSGRSDLLTEKVVVEIGTNYLGDRALFRQELDRLMGLLVNVEHVLWLSNSRYATRMDAVNDEIRSAARRYPNLQIAEWGPLSDNNSGFTADDGIHLHTSGADAMAELIRAHLEGEVPWNRLPVGQIGSIRDGRKALTVKGWVSNPDLGRTAMVRLVVDGELIEKKRTHKKRAALARKISSDVQELGFDFKLALPDGRHEVCIEANNFDGYAPVVMQCRAIEIRHSPTGSIEKVVEKNRSQVVRGWADDPDHKKPVLIEARSGDPAGEVIASVVANRKSTDGRKNRFALTVASDVGTYCVVAQNVLAGDDLVLGCITPE